MIQLELFRSDEFILCPGNGRQQGFFLIGLCIHAQTLADILHDAFLVVRVINDKIRVIAQTVDVASENPYAGGMEGGNPDAL